MIIYNLKEILREKGLTQKELAERTGLSQSTISAIANGAEPKEDTLAILLKGLGVSEAQISEKTTQEINRCPRCGNTSIVEWFNHGNKHVRLKCAYCEADSGEQVSKAEAVRIFRSFEHRAERRAHANVYVFSLAELLDSVYFDADDVRPVWFENRGLFIVPALLQYGVAERERELVKVLWFGKMSASSYMLANYGTAWRCWNSKPTAERSDAEQWK